MEISYTESQEMLAKRFEELPQIKALVNDSTFDTKLNQILEFSEVDTQLFPLIKNEILVILALYAPISELSGNIAETTGISLEKASGVAALVETLMLEPVYKDLVAFEVLWNQKLTEEESLPQADGTLKEKLELRPEASAQVTPSTVTPLTREAVLDALSPSRTMAKDINSLQSEKT